MTNPSAHEDWSKFNWIPGQSATQAFIVINTDSPRSAIETTGVAVNQKYRWDAVLKATPNPSVANLEGPYTFLVTWQYTRPEGGEHKDNDKLKRKARVRWKFGSTTIEMDQNIFGTPHTNSAGSPVRPKYRKLINTLQFDVFKYFPSFEVGYALQFMNKLNKNAFQLDGVGMVESEQCFCSYVGPTGDLEIGGIEPVEVMHSFEVRNSIISGQKKDFGFKYAYLDRGRRGWYKDSAGVDRMGPITYKSDGPEMWVEVSEDVALNGDGTPTDRRLYKIGKGNTPVAAPALYKKSLGVKIDNYYASDKQLATIIHSQDEPVDFQPMLNALSR